jgi:hypothetical protein
VAHELQLILVARALAAPAAAPAHDQVRALPPQQPALPAEHEALVRDAREQPRHTLVAEPEPGLREGCVVAAQHVEVRHIAHGDDLVRGVLCEPDQALRVEREERQLLEHLAEARAELA